MVLDVVETAQLAPSVAVCIPTYNQVKYLILAIESIVQQNMTPDEIWISDDASNDGTSDYLSALIAKSIGGGIKLHLITQLFNLGMVSNTDLVMRMPQTDFIVKLDSDDLLHPNFISSLSGKLHASPAAGFAHAAAREIGTQGNERRIRRLARATGYEPPTQAVRSAFYGYKVAANICMFRRSALEAVNFYRRDLSFAEDWDLAFRLAAGGYGNIYVRDVWPHIEFGTMRAAIERQEKVRNLRPSETSLTTL